MPLMIINIGNNTVLKVYSYDVKSYTRDVIFMTAMSTMYTHDNTLKWRIEHCYKNKKNILQN